MYEVVYTSADQTLEGSGYGVVAHTDGMAQPLLHAARELGSYNVGEGDGSPLLGHAILTVSGRRWSVLSRSLPVGADYSSREVYLAHHLVFAADEVPSASPARVLRDGKWFSEWIAPPTRLAPRKLAVKSKSPHRCGRWETHVGDAGWAGEVIRLAQAAAGRAREGRVADPVLLCLPGSADALNMWIDALDLLPGSAWKIPFVIGAQSARQAERAALVVAAPGGRAARELARHSIVLDLSRSPPPVPVPVSPFTTAARAGEAIQNGAAPATARPVPAAVESEDGGSGAIRPILGAGSWGGATKPAWGRPAAPPPPSSVTEAFDDEDDEEVEDDPVLPLPPVPGPSPWTYVIVGGGVGVAAAVALLVMVAMRPTTPVANNGPPDKDVNRNTPAPDKRVAPPKDDRPIDESPTPLDPLKPFRAPETPPIPGPHPPRPNRPMPLHPPGADPTVERPLVHLAADKFPDATELKEPVTIVESDLLRDVNFGAPDCKPMLYNGLGQPAAFEWSAGGAPLVVVVRVPANGNPIPALQISKSGNKLVVQRMVNLQPQTAEAALHVLALCGLEFKGPGDSGAVRFRFNPDDRPFPLPSGKEGLADAGGGAGMGRVVAALNYWAKHNAGPAANGDWNAFRLRAESGVAKAGGERRLFHDAEPAIPVSGAQLRFKGEGDNGLALNLAVEEFQSSLNRNKPSLKLQWKPESSMGEDDTLKRLYHGDGHLVARLELPMIVGRENNGDKVEPRTVLRFDKKSEGGPPAAAPTGRGQIRKERRSRPWMDDPQLSWLRKRFDAFLVKGKGRHP